MAWSPSQKQMDCIYVHKFHNGAKGLDPPGLDTKNLCVARLCGAGEKGFPCACCSVKRHLYPCIQQNWVFIEDCLN